MKGRMDRLETLVRRQCRDSASHAGDDAGNVGVYGVR
jgi:hypothetical protein